MHIVLVSQKIYEVALRNLIYYLENLEALYEAKGSSTPDPGIVFIDRHKPIEELPKELLQAMLDPQRPVTYKPLEEGCILEIRTSSNPERSGTVKISSIGFIYETHSGYGTWDFAFDCNVITFSGRRNSFLWGGNSLFRYEPKDIEAATAFKTSAPDKPLIFKGVIIPDLREATEDELRAAGLQEQPWHQR